MLELFKKYYYIDDVLEFDYENELDRYVDIINQIRIEKVGIDDKNFKKEFKELLDNNEQKRLQFISMFDSSDFSLIIKEVNVLNIYDVDINKSVRIPKIFSEYAINKVWNDSLVAENKLQVEYSMLNQLILKNIICGDFKSNYLVSIVPSLLKKEDKLKRLLKIFDNDIGKELISIKITYTMFIDNKELILYYIREGFQFAVILDNKYYEDNNNKNTTDIFKYIIINNKEKMTNELKELRNIIIMN